MFWSGCESLPFLRWCVSQLNRVAKQKMTFLPSNAGYDLALIAIDSAALSYQSSLLKIFGRLMVLPSTPFVFSS